MLIDNEGMADAKEDKKIYEKTKINLSVSHAET